MKHLAKSGSRAKRSKVVPLVSTGMGRRIAVLERRCADLEGQRTMLVRAIGALIVANAPGVEEPVYQIPFSSMNAAREIGFAVEKSGANPGLVVAVSKPTRDETIDSEREVAAMIDAEESETIERAKDEHRRRVAGEDLREERDRSTRRQ